MDSEQTIEIILQARDEASGAIGAVGAALRALGDASLPQQITQLTQAMTQLGQAAQQTSALITSAMSAQTSVVQAALSQQSGAIGLAMGQQSAAVGASMAARTAAITSGMAAQTAAVVAGLRAQSAAYASAHAAIGVPSVGTPASAIAGSHPSWDMSQPLAATGTPISQVVPPLAGRFSLAELQTLIEIMDRLSKVTIDESSSFNILGASVDRLRAGLAPLASGWAAVGGAMERVRLAQGGAGGAGSADGAKATGGAFDNLRRSSEGLLGPLERVYYLAGQYAIWYVGFSAISQMSQGVRTLAQDLISLNITYKEQLQTFSALYTPPAQKGASPAQLKANQAQGDALGQQALSWLDAFAEQTPATREDIRQVGISFAAAGDDVGVLTRAAEVLSTTFHNTGGVISATQAIIDAQFGRTEMLRQNLHITTDELKQYGLVVEKNGHLVQDTFIPAIVNMAHAIDTSTDPIGRQMKTLGGALSNLGDVAQETWRRLGAAPYATLERTLEPIIASLGSTGNETGADQIALAKLLGPGGSGKGVGGALTSVADQLGKSLAHAMDGALASLDAWYQKIGGLPGLLIAGQRAWIEFAAAARTAFSILGGVADGLTNIWGALTNLASIFGQFGQVFASVFGQIGHGTDLLRNMISTVVTLAVEYKLLASAMGVASSAAAASGLGSLRAVIAPVPGGIGPPAPGTLAADGLVGVMGRFAGGLYATLGPMAAFTLALYTIPQAISDVVLAFQTWRGKDVLGAQPDIHLTIPAQYQSTIGPPGGAGALQTAGPGRFAAYLQTTLGDEAYKDWAEMVQHQRPSDFISYLQQHFSLVGPIGAEYAREGGQGGAAYIRALATGTAPGLAPQQASNVYTQFNTALTQLQADAASKQLRTQLPSDIALAASFAQAIGKDQGLTGAQQGAVYQNAYDALASQYSKYLPAGAIAPGKARPTDTYTSDVFATNLQARQRALQADLLQDKGQDTLSADYGSIRAVLQRGVRQGLIDSSQMVIDLHQAFASISQNLKQKLTWDQQMDAAPAQIKRDLAAYTASLARGGASPQEVSAERYATEKSIYSAQAQDAQSLLQAAQAAQAPWPVALDLIGQVASDLAGAHTKLPLITQQVVGLVQSYGTNALQTAEALHQPLSSLLAILNRTASAMAAEGASTAQVDLYRTLTERQLLEPYLRQAATSAQNAYSLSLNASTVPGTGQITTSIAAIIAAQRAVPLAPGEQQADRDLSLRILQNQLLKDGYERLLGQAREQFTMDKDNHQSQQKLLADENAYLKILAQEPGITKLDVAYQRAQLDKERLGDIAAIAAIGAPPPHYSQFGGLATAYGSATVSYGGVRDHESATLRELRQTNEHLRAALARDDRLITVLESELVVDRSQLGTLQSIDRHVAPPPPRPAQDVHAHLRARGSALLVGR